MRMRVCGDRDLESLPLYVGSSSLRNMVIRVKFPVYNKKDAPLPTFQYPPIFSIASVVSNTSLWNILEQN